MSDDRRREFRSPQSDEHRARPFPREAYVFGWLAICFVVAEGINDLVSGVFGTGAILICLVPLMVWLMHFRPRRQSDMTRRR